MPYSVTVNLQAESLTPGAFLKEWCALKQILLKRETRLAQEIVKSMEKREEAYCGTNSFLLECLSIPDTEIADTRAKGKCKN